jgi:hypothetical protein
VAFAEAGDLGRIFPEGDYTVTFHTAHDGNQDVTLTFGEDAYPNAPTLRNFASTQALDSLQPITLEWDPMNGGTEADYIELYVEGDFACYFESPAPGEPGALDGRSTSITIPAETLPPGRTLDCELVFARVSDTNTDDYPGLEAAAGFFSITEFQIRTIGDPFTPQLKVTHDQGIAFVTVTAEIGSYYELRASDDLQNWSPVWGGYLWDDCDGYKGTLEFAEDVSGMPARFYQLFEIDFGD